MVSGGFVFILEDLRSGQLPPEIVAQCQLWGFEDLSPLRLEGCGTTWGPAGRDTPWPARQGAALPGEQPAGSNQGSSFITERRH